MMAVKKEKTARKLERHFKGVSNHRRIEILLLIRRRPGIIFEQIVEELGGNEKTLGEHTRRLVIAGLVQKEYAGRTVCHKVTPYGEIFTDFIRTFGNIKDSTN